jgi:hypothetical protein
MQQDWVQNNFLAETLGHARALASDGDNRVPIASDSLVLTRPAVARQEWSVW